MEIALFEAKSQSNTYRSFSKAARVNRYLRICRSNVFSECFNPTWLHELVVCVFYLTHDIQCWWIHRGLLKTNLDNYFDERGCRLRQYFTELFEQGNGISVKWIFFHMIKNELWLFKENQSQIFKSIIKFVSVSQVLFSFPIFLMIHTQKVKKKFYPHPWFIPPQLCIKSAVKYSSEQVHILNTSTKTFEKKVWTLSFLNFILRCTAPPFSKGHRLWLLCILITSNTPKNIELCNFFSYNDCHQFIFSSPDNFSASRKEICYSSPSLPPSQMVMILERAGTNRKSKLHIL